MKTFLMREWKKLKTWVIRTWHELDNWPTFFLFLFVCLVIYSPVWVGYLLYFLFRWHWALIMATAVLAFWAGPFTPFFPTCIAITLAIRDFILHLARRQKRKS